MASEKAILFALGEYLSDWPEHMTGTEVLAVLFATPTSDIPDDITIWEPFENYPSNWVAGHIEALANHVDVLLEAK